MRGVVEMSIKELERLNVLHNVRDKTITQAKAAELLGISDRQIRNLLARFDKNGAQGLISMKRGCPSNHRKSSEFKERVLSIIKEKYDDFGPTFVREKLAETYDISVSTETLRKWMTEVHLWMPKREKVRVHPTRKRRTCFGEMIQVDGSHEFWFEERGEKCVAIVFIDDATSKITSLHFSRGESLEAYFMALKKHLVHYGRPRSIYSDRFSVFDSPVEGNLTQFKRALQTLNIESILANSPQGKGRVERANRTLQDRLIKEMRLLDISTIEKANEYADEFMEKFNKKFSKEAASPFNAHRPLETATDLSRILNRYEERTITKNGEFQFQNRFYRVTEALENTTSFRGKKIEVRSGNEGTIRVFLENMELKVIQTDSIAPDTLNKNEIQWKERSYKTPSASHPWKRGWRTKTRIRSTKLTKVI